MSKNYGIILAAGMGTRINYIVGALAKQFLRINSMELFLYPITSLWSVGVDSFVVVTNPIIMDKIDEILKKHSTILGYDYEITFNPYPNSLNGNSLVIGLKEIIKHSKEKPIFLSVSDHVFDPEMPTDLIESTFEGDIIVLGDPEPVLVNIDEATKIQANNDHIVMKVGKQLDEYNYIDTGLFLIKSPHKIIKLFNEEKPIKLSEIVANKDLLTYVQPCRKQYVWKDIDEFEDLGVLLTNEMKNIIIKYERLINSSRNKWVNKSW
ncbi:MAG: NTP transferase domain-containing protein [Staphylothermus sp.]|nr:NTP transferase domain-containing protein [Staphylothermus sp.]